MATSVSGPWRGQPGYGYVPPPFSGAPPMYSAAQPMYSDAPQPSSMATTMFSGGPPATCAISMVGGGDTQPMYGGVPMGSDGQHPMGSMGQGVPFKNSEHFVIRKIGLRVSLSFWLSF